MKLFAVHSPAFAKLWEPFKRSVETRTSFELHAEELPARFDGCYWGQPVYHEMLRWLVERRLRLLESETEVFATSGIDTEFWRDAVPDLTARMDSFWPNDLLGADDKNFPPRLCSCLYVMRPTDSVRALMKAVLDDPRCGPEIDDPILNEKRDMVKWSALPHSLYWNTSVGWKVGDPLPPLPFEVFWTHFNWTSNLVDKFALAEAVRAEWHTQHRSFIGTNVARAATDSGCRSDSTGK